MRKRLVIIGIIAALLFLGWFALRPAPRREPLYQGRTLTQWLMDYSNALRQLPGYSGVETLQRSTNAVRNIGTNGIPILLNKLAAKENRVEHFLAYCLGRQRMIRFHFTDSRLENLLGLQGFWILGKDAVSAVPALTQFTKHADRQLRCFALDSLECVQPRRETFVPILVRTLHDPDVEVRAISARLLRKLYPEEAEKAGVYKMYPFLKPFNKPTVSTNKPVRKK